MKQNKKNLPTISAQLISGLLGLVLLVSGCNSGSDAAAIFESKNTELLATVSYYEGMAPTMTQQAVNLQSTVMALQTEVGSVRAENRNLTARLNGNPANQPNTSITNAVPNTNAANVNTNTGTTTDGIPGMPNSGGTTQLDPNASTGGSVNAPQTSATGLIIERVSLTKSKDANGCAVGETASFLSTDTEIYVIAVVRNFQTGTKFTTTWQGDGLDQQYDWTSDYSAQQECVHFYIEPNVLGLLPGTYTVTFTATGLQGIPLQFTIVQAQ